MKSRASCAYPTRHLRLPRKARPLLVGLTTVSIALSIWWPAHAATPQVGEQAAASSVFQGRVYEGEVGDESRPLEGVSVSLYRAGNPYPDPGQLIATTTTNAEGWYGLTADDGGEYYSIREDNPSGYESVGATTVDGTVRDPDWIEYVVPLGDLTLTGNKFWDSSGAPPTPTPTMTGTTPPTPTPTATPTMTGTNPPTATPAPSWTPTPTPVPGGRVNWTVCAVADAEIDQAQPDSNMGDAVDLTVGWGQGSNEPYANRILLQFDLGFIPPGAEVVDAHLEMRMIAADGANPAAVSVYRVLDMWDEMGVTWNSRPAVDTHHVAQEAIDSAVPGVRGWDLRSVVQQWIEGIVPNHGIEIRGSESGSYWWRSFDARHYTIFCPRLVLTLNTTGTVPTPTPTPTLTPTPTPPSSCPQADGGGSSFSTATTIMAGVQVEEYICPSADVDWFKVPVEAPQEMSVYLYDLPSGPAADLDVYLYDPTGAEVGSSAIFGAEKGGYINHTATQTGDYRVMVRGKGVADWSPTKTYKLRVDLKFNCDFPDEAGDTFQSATGILPSITAGNTIRMHSAYICPQKDVDYFKFYVPFGQQVTLTAKLTDLPADFDLELYKPDGDLTSISSTAGTATEEVSVVATNLYGYWRVAVKSPSGASHNRPYTLEVILTGNADFSVAGIEVTQGIQDLGNTVTLAAGKSTVARVYVDPGSVVSETSGVEVELHGWYYSWGLQPLPGSPLKLGPREVTDEKVENKKRLFAKKSFNFHLPKSWTMSGDLTLKATVNPERSLPESKFDNNELTDTITVRDIVPLNLGLVPIKSKGLVSTLKNNPDLASMLTYLRASFPVGQIKIWYMVGTYEMDYDMTVAGEEGCGPGWLDVLDDLEDIYDGWSNRPFNAVVYGLLPLGVPVAEGGCGSPSARSAGGYLDPTSGYVMAHEIGHIFYRLHSPSDRDSSGIVNNIHCSDPGQYSEDLSYPHYTSPTGVPYARSSIGEVGFNVFTNETYNPLQEFDFMSYCSPRWVSPYTWDRIAYAMPTSPKTVSENADGRQVLISGIAVGDYCEFRPYFWVRDRGAGSGAADTGPYTIELRDSSGAVLGSRSFDTEDPVAGVDRAKGMFREWITCPEGVAAVAVVYEGEDIAVRQVSATAPSVTLISPNGGELWGQSGTARIEWTAEDDDALAANLFISSDDGATWMPLAVNQRTDFHDINLATVPGGNSMRVKVEVSDGFNTVSDVSDAVFAADEKPPVPLLQAPEAGALVRRGDGVAMTGDALDLQNGVLDSSGLKWHSSVVGYLGSWRDNIVTGLPCGAHEIVLEAAGGSGPVGVEAVDIAVHVGCDDRVYVLPASAHVRGLEGTNWMSDVVLHNPSQLPALAMLYLLKNGLSGSPFRAVVPSTGSVVLADVLGEDFGLEARSGGVLIASSSSLLASSRTYNDAESGTFGQYVPVEAESLANSGNDPVTLIQLTRNADFRTNIGFTNLGRSDLNVEIALFSSSGSHLGSKGYSVDPYSFFQVTDILHKVGSDSVDDAYAVIRAEDVDASYFAYASIIDNHTGDPIYAFPTKTSTSALYIPAAAHLRGANNTEWRTDLEVYNSGNSGAWYEIELLAHGADNSMPENRLFTLAPKNAVRYGDVLESVFGFEGSAALRVTPIEGEIAVTSRTYNQLEVGTTGQFAPGVPEQTAIRFGQEARLIQLSQSATDSTGFRTNIGFASATREPIRVEIELFSGDGTHLGTTEDWLDPLGFRQLNKVFRRVTSEDVDDGYAVVRSTTEGAAFFCYATVIDNRSGDPILIPGRQWILSDHSTH